MTRTTAEAVALIIETEDGDNLSPFIESASLLVDRIAALDSPPSETEMELVERWLAAHYYGVFKQRAASEKAGPVSESKQYYLSHGFQTTMHGTQAMSLDSTGTLATINREIAGDIKPKNASVHFLGSNGNFRRVNY